MADIKFPLTAKSGDLEIAIGAEEVQSQILLYLSTIKGELMWNTTHGIPFYLFDARKNADRDIALVETELSIQFPYVQFEVTGQLDDNGLLYLLIAWLYQARSDRINLTIEIP